MIFNLFSQKKDRESAKNKVLVVGLGNFEDKYILNRHNVGFMVVDELQDKINASSWSKERNYFVSKGNFGDTEIVLLKPHTYMNKSGEALSEYLRYNAEPKKIIVVHDDMDMVLGKVRLQQNGGTGGHNGVESIKNHYKDDIERVKVGIVSEATERFRKENPSDFVLSNFLEEEHDKVKEVIKRATGKIVEVIE